MPVVSIKRKETVVKAVRRAATRHLDTAIAAVPTASAAGAERVASAADELEALRALLLLVRGPLGREVFNREHRAVQRCVKALSPPDTSADELLRALASAEPAIELTTEAARADDEPARKPGRKKAGPDPKRLRLLADLAELRMRARYWHLPGGEFELLAPGLRRAYQAAAKAGRATPVEADGGPLLLTLHRQLGVIERVWPDAVGPYRKSLRLAAREAAELSLLEGFTSSLGGHPQREALLERVSVRRGELEPKLRRRGAMLFAETPSAFAKRVGAYWAAWRAS